MQFAAGGLQWAVSSKEPQTAYRLLPTTSKQLAVGRKLKVTANSLLLAAH